MNMDQQSDPASMLTPFEEFWRDRQRFLESRGYMLRPRYNPDWKPSWRERNVPFYKAEDAIPLPVRPSVVDATRISDGKLVYIKRIKPNSRELEIVTFLSSPDMRQDPRNRCVPVLDVLRDPDDSDTCYMVMPFLRYIDDPDFEIFENILEFGDQILEGLLYLHDHGIAHRDCAYKNIMMDATELYPKGFHPVFSIMLPDISTYAPRLSRAAVSVAYYFTDFGISSRFGPDDSTRLVLGRDGLEQSVPELSDDTPYDPFKVDIYIIGALLKSRILQKFSNIDMIAPLANRMTRPDPAARPDAAEALREWRAVRRSVPRFRRFWRLKRRDESFIGSALRDAWHIPYTVYRMLF